MRVSILPKTIYERDTEFAKLDSEEVFSTVIIPSGEIKQCAKYVRAYCDLLVEHDFESLKDIYYIAIRSYSVLDRIFLMAGYYGLLKYKEIINFLIYYPL